MYVCQMLCVCIGQRDYSRARTEVCAPPPSSFSIFPSISHTFPISEPAGSRKCAIMRSNNRHPHLWRRSRAGRAQRSSFLSPCINRKMLRFVSVSAALQAPPDTSTLRRLRTYEIMKFRFAHEIVRTAIPTCFLYNNGGGDPFERGCCRHRR